MTSISWTGQTWNPVVGCSIVSKGCTHCYAMGMAHRLGSMAKTPHYRGLTMKVNGHPVWTGRIAAAPDHIWQEPLRRRKPTTWFVNSMGDLFHDAMPTELIDRVFAIMALCPRHTFQVLTKRPDRMRDYMADAEARIQGRLRCVDRFIATGGEHGRGLDAWPLPNVWLGTSVEDQATADSRIPPLLDTPAALRFISAEPLLGPVDLEPWLNWPDNMSMLPPRDDEDFGCIGCDSYCSKCPQTKAVYVDDTGPKGQDGCPEWVLCERQTLDWVICGGESGPGARPMHPDWARSLRDQCAAAGIPFHFKQWGNWLPLGQVLPGCGKIHGASAVRPGRMKLHYGGAPDRAPEHAFAKHGVEFGSAPDGVSTFRVGTKAAGNLLDGVEHAAIPPHAGGA
jgi:protein gp37